MAIGVGVESALVNLGIEVGSAAASARRGSWRDHCTSARPARAASPAATPPGADYTAAALLSDQDHLKPLYYAVRRRRRLEPGLTSASTTRPTWSAGIAVGIVLGGWARSSPLPFARN